MSRFIDMVGGNGRRVPARAGEVVAVTGASAGVGRAVVREFARRGARLGLIARGSDGLEAAFQEVRALGGEAIVLVADVSRADQVEAAAAALEDAFGPVDVWINNAMVSVFSPVKEMTADEYRRVTEVTYLGVVHGTQAALRRMLPRDRGAIVQVGSALAYRSIPLQSAYCAAKHAMVGFTDSLRCELHHDGSAVRLTVVHLPAMNTPQFTWVKSRLPNRPQPVPPIFQPEVAARAIYWAAHHDRRELLVGLPTVKAVLGQKLIPGWLDRYLGRMGYASQQTDSPEDPSRPNNLLAPLPGDHGARNGFEGRSRGHSVESWASMHRGAAASLALGLAGLLIAGAGLLTRKRR